MEEAKKQDLERCVERRENIEAEIKALQEDKKELNKEIKSKGYDITMVNSVIKLRAMEESDRQEAVAILDSYCKACGVKQYNLGIV
jgi:uncharacterized protein (UPF0335 family)